MKYDNRGMLRLHRLANDPEFMRSPDGRRDDPAVEAAVDGIRDELNERRVGPTLWTAEQAADLNRAIANLNTPDDEYGLAPAWDREPSADLGVEIDGAAIVGAACLVALVVFFIVAVIAGAL